MYYKNYEDYMKSILGYPIQEQNLFSNTYSNYNNMEYEYITQMPRYSKEILDLYPEIYKIVNPMVCKLCEANTKPITKELLEQMTEEIYLNIESDPSEYVSQVVNVKVNLPNQEEKRQGKNIASNSVNSPKATITRKENRVEEKINTENRQVRRNNNTLRDLIKILILNQLLGGNLRPMPRPPRPPFPMRPEINPIPPRPQPRSEHNNFFM